eukprot:134306-Chlamydomonas_euryale.AAC.1
MQRSRLQQGAHQSPGIMRAPVTSQALPRRGEAGPVTQEAGQPVGSFLACSPSWCHRANRGRGVSGAGCVPCNDVSPPQCAVADAFPFALLGFLFPCRPLCLPFPSAPGGR